MLGRVYVCFDAKTSQEASIFLLWMVKAALKRKGIRIRRTALYLKLKDEDGSFMWTNGVERLVVQVNSDEEGSDEETSSSEEASEEETSSEDNVDD